MKAPQPPIRQSLASAVMPLAWAGYFSALFTYLRFLPPSGEALPEYADDAEAASAGLPLYGYYRTGSLVKQRMA